jgi:hypothetical protein
MRARRSASDAEDSLPFPQAVFLLEEDEDAVRGWGAQKAGLDKFDAFAAEYSWMDGAKDLSRAAAALLLQYASNEPFLNRDLAKRYFEVVSEPKRLKICDAPNALNAEATRDRIAFLAEPAVVNGPYGCVVLSKSASRRAAAGVNE